MLAKFSFSVGFFKKAGYVLYIHLDDGVDNKIDDSFDIVLCVLFIFYFYEITNIVWNKVIKLHCFSLLCLICYYEY